MKNIRNLEELKLELCKMADICGGKTVVYYTEDVLFNMESPTNPKPIYLSYKPIYSSDRSAFINSNSCHDTKYPGVITRIMRSLATEDKKKTFNIAYIEKSEVENPITINLLLNQLTMVDNPEDYEAYIVNGENKLCDLYCGLWYCGDSWTCFLIATDNLVGPDFDYKDSDGYSKTEEMEDE